MTLNQAQIWHHLDGLAKPQRSLGRLEAIAVELAMTQQSLSPQTMPRRIVLFAGDHGVAAQGVTPWPSAVTTAMVRTILSGRATSTALARAHHVDVRLVDVGIATPLTGKLPQHYNAAGIAAGTADLSKEPAMTVAQFDTAWAIGASEAELALAAGYRLLIAGEMGIGNTTASACITHLLTGISADQATGQGAGADDVMRARKCDIVSAAVSRLAGATNKAALAAIAGFEIVAMAGFYATGAKPGVTLLLDGYVATAAALIAEHLYAGTAKAMIAAHQSAEPGHRSALRHLGLVPILDWQMRLGEGTGALTALPLLDAASAVLGDVATLAEVMGA